MISEFNVFVCLKLFGKRNIEIDYAMEMTVSLLLRFPKTLKHTQNHSKSLKRVDSDCFSVGVLDLGFPNGGRVTTFRGRREHNNFKRKCKMVCSQRPLTIVKT